MPPNFIARSTRRGVPTLLFSSLSVKPPNAVAQMDRATALQARDESAERQWAYEIKLDGYRMAARVEDGRAKLLTRSGLDWTAKYPATAAAFAKLKVTTAYLDGELCGVGADGLRSFSQTQAASNGERGVRLVYYVFDLLHLDGRETASLRLIERKALLDP